MKDYSPEYLENVREIIARGDEAAARRLLADLHPADIADLYQDLNLSEAEFLYKLLEDDVAADVLMELDEDDRRKLLSTIPAEKIARRFIEQQGGTFDNGMAEMFQEVLNRLSLQDED